MSEVRLESDVFVESAVVVPLGARPATANPMIAIVVVNADAFGVLFRNVAIACGAFALAAHSHRERTERTGRHGLDAEAVSEVSNKEGMR